MTLLRMFLLKVDPFAVYQAERELAQHSLSIPRETLVSHYLVRGQLRTLVNKVIADPMHLDKCLAAAIIEGPDESKNPRFVAPFLTGRFYSAVAFVPITLALLIHAINAVRHVPAQVFAIDLRLLVAIPFFTIATCMTFGFLGSKIGVKKATNWIGLLIGLGLLVAMIALTQYLDHH